MPIQFRCHHCRQVLSITSKKAGLEVACPNCRELTRVPTMEDVAAAVQSGKGQREPRAERPVATEHAASPGPSGAAAPARARPTEDAWRSAAAQRNPWTDEEADEEPGFSLKRRKADESRPDMTPMADIVFLLLTFFMLTASFTVQKSMQADPPEPDEDAASSQAVAVEQGEDETVIVGIDATDHLTLENEPVGSIGALADALRAKLAESGGKAELTIESDPRCSFGIMVGVMDAGISVGMQRIRRLPRPVTD